MTVKFIDLQPCGAPGQSYRNLTDMGISTSGYHAFSIVWEVETPDTATVFNFGNFLNAAQIRTNIKGNGDGVVVQLFNAVGASILSARWPLAVLTPGVHTIIEIDCNTATNSIAVFQDGFPLTPAVLVWGSTNAIANITGSGFTLGKNDVPLSVTNCSGDFAFYVGTQVPIGTPIVLLETSTTAAAWGANSSGTGGAFTPIHTAHLCGTPCAPTPACGGVHTTTSFTAEWTPNGIGATSYNVQYRRVGDVSFTTISGILTTSQLITGLVSGASYEFKVEGVNTDGEGGYSGLQECSTIDSSLTMDDVAVTSLAAESPCTAAVFDPVFEATGPSLGLRWSDTRGKSFGNPVPQDFSADPLWQPQWNRTGMARDRVFELFWSAAVKTALNGAFVEVAPLKS